MDNPLLFGWLPVFLDKFFGFLRGWHLTESVTMFGFLLGLCLLIVVIRSLLLKGWRYELLRLSGLFPSDYRFAWISDFKIRCMDGSRHRLLEYAFEFSSYGSLVPFPFGRCGSYIEIILPEVARCMNYFLSLCRDFPWTTHWSIFAVFCFLSWLLGYFSASCIRSLSRIRWRVKKCLRVSLRLLTGFFRPFWRLPISFSAYGFFSCSFHWASSL